MRDHGRPTREPATYNLCARPTRHDVREEVNAIPARPRTPTRETRDANSRDLARDPATCRSATTHVWMKKGTRSLAKRARSSLQPLSPANDSPRVLRRLRVGFGDTGGLRCAATGMAIRYSPLRSKSKAASRTLRPARRDCVIVRAQACVVPTCVSENTGRRQVLRSRRPSSRRLRRTASRWRR